MFSLAGSVAPTPPAAVDAIYQLLAIIADPATHRARLDALVAARDEAERKLAEIGTAQGTLDDIRANYEAAAAKSLSATAEAKAAQVALGTAQTDLDNRERAYAVRLEADRAAAAQRSVALEERTSAVSDREIGVHERENVCYAREVDLGEKHRKVDAALKDVEAKQAEYAMKLAELKKITG